MILSHSKTGRYFCDGIEISEEEYISVVTELKEKALWVDRVYKGVSDISEVPSEWKTEIQSRVVERQNTAIDSDEITLDDALEALNKLGVKEEVDIDGNT